MKYNINKLIRILEKVTKRKVILEDELPSFLSYDNLFIKNAKDEEVLDEDEDDGDVITKPKPKVKPSPTIPKPKKRPSPLTPTHPVTQPKPKSLKEAKDMSDDSFFQPKNLRQKEEKVKEKERKLKRILSKIRLGLKNIKAAYKNRDWKTKEEELFLKIFSHVQLYKFEHEYFSGYSLMNGEMNEICFFDLKKDIFWVDNNDIWGMFGKKFHWKYNEMQSFIEQMLKKHFKLNELVIDFER